MSLAKRIIPCLDCENGRVVKGVKFLDIRDAGDPVEVSKRYCDEELMRLPFWISLPVATIERQPFIPLKPLLVRYLFL